MKLKIVAALAATACGVALAQMAPPNTGVMRADKESPNAGAQRAYKDAPATSGRQVAAPPPQSGALLPPAQPQASPKLQSGRSSVAARPQTVGRAEGDDPDEDRKAMVSKAQATAPGKPLLGAGAPAPGELPGGDRQKPADRKF